WAAKDWPRWAPSRQPALRCAGVSSREYRAGSAAATTPGANSTSADERAGCGPIACGATGTPRRASPAVRIAAAGSSSTKLDGDRRAFATADAQARHAALEALLTERVEQRHDDP